MNAARSIDAVRILTRSEIAAVIADLKRKRRSRNTRQNLVIFRLATCCGLRVSEVVGLKLSNVRVAGARPHLVVPKAIAKRGVRRTVPLWWDAATLADLTAWKAERQAMGAGPGDAFACSLNGGRNPQTGRESAGEPLSVRNAQQRFKQAIKCLGEERVATLSIHAGRHSFCSHSLAGGRNVVEVRDAAGHANVSTTSQYLHAIRDDDEGVGDLFAFGA